MKASVVNHPSRDPLIIIRAWQLEACDGNGCEAALLSYLEYWHCIKMEHSVKAHQSNIDAESHGSQPVQDESRWQFHSLDELERGLLIYGHTTISAAIKGLVERGFIQTGRNPNPRYRFDKTTFFLFLPEKVNQWLADHRKSENRQSKGEVRSAANVSRSSEIGSWSTNNGEAIPETSSEVSTETTCQENVNPSLSEVKNTSDEKSNLNPNNGSQPSKEKENSAKEREKKTVKSPPSESAAELAQCLRLCILENNPEARVTDQHVLKWGRTADLMMRNDHRGFEATRDLILWTQRDEFWRTNILSMEKLREKFDQLTLKKKGARGNSNETRAQQRQAANLVALARAKNSLHGLDPGAIDDFSRDF